MSDTVDLAFIGMRLDTIQKDNADIRRRLSGLNERFSGFEQRLRGVEQSCDRLVERFDHLTERVSGLEGMMAEALLLLRRLEKRTGELK